MTVTTNERGQQNIFAKEPQVYAQEITVTHNEKAEMLNGRLAMLGVIAAIGAYLTIGLMGSTQDPQSTSELSINNLQWPLTSGYICKVG